MIYLKDDDTYVVGYDIYSPYEVTQKRYISTDADYDEVLTILLSILYNTNLDIVDPINDVTFIIDGEHNRHYNVSQQIKYAEREKYVTL